MPHLKILTLVLTTAMLTTTPLFAGAMPQIEERQESLPKEAATHSLMRLTPDKSELVHLPRSAASIIVGNSTHINIMADSADTLVVVPRQAGASHFTVLDESGDIIMQRHVIVASPKKNYLRVRRACANGDESCATTSVYFCPGMCHEIAMSDGEETLEVDTEEPIGRSSSSANGGQAAPQADSP